LTHFFKTFKGSEPQRNFKIGIAIPCYEADGIFLETCLNAIRNLNPQPYITVVDVNWDELFNQARKDLSEYLFCEEKCDVVLHGLVDCYLLPKMLNHVKRNRIVSFASLSLKRYDLTFALYHLLFRNMGWEGIYSLPIETWEQFKDEFEDYDSGIWRTVGRFQYDFCRRYSYYSLRSYKKSSVQELLKTKSLFKKLVWRMMRMGIR